MTKIICHRTVKFRQRGEEGSGFKAVVYRDGVFNEAQWNTFGTIGHVEGWTNTSDSRNGCRVGDLFQIVGSATDTHNSHVLTYRCDNASGNLHGSCIAHQMTPAGAKGEDATGCYVLMGEWKPNTQYAYNTERRDVVLVDGVKKRVKNRGTFTSRSSFDTTEAARWEDATNVPFASMELILVDVAFIEKLIATRLQTGISMTPRINISGNEMQIFSKFSDSDGNEVPAMRTVIDEDGAVHFRFMNPNTGTESDFSYKGFSQTGVTETPNEFTLLGNFIRSTSASATFAALCSSWRTSSIPLYTVKSGYQMVNGQLQPILNSGEESKVYLSKRTTDTARQGTYYEFFHQSYGSKLYIGYIVTVAMDGTYSRYKFYHNSEGNRVLISNFSGHDFTFAEVSNQVAQDFSKQDMIQEELEYDDQIVLAGH